MNFSAGFRTTFWLIGTVHKAAPKLSWSNVVLTIFLMASPAVNVTATAALITALSRASSLQEVVPPLVILLTSVALFTPLASAATSLRNYLGNVLRAELRTRLAQQVSRTPLAELFDQGAAARTAAADEGIDAYVVWQYHETVLLAQNTVAAAAVVTTVWAMDWRAGILTSAALMPILLGAMYVGRYVEAAYDRSAGFRSRETYTRELLVRQRTAVELASLGSAGRLADAVGEYWTKINAEAVRVLRPQIVAGAIAGLTSAILLTGALLSVIVGANYGPTAAAGVIGVVAALAAVAGIGSAIAGIVVNSAAAAQVRLFLQRDLRSRDHAVQPPVEELQISHVSHIYDNSDREVLHDININVRRGEIVALVGRNGAGKSTLVNVSVGLLQPKGGTVSIDGLRFSEAEEASWLGFFGLLTQDFGRYELTVRQALVLGLPNASLTLGHKTGRSSNGDPYSKRAADFWDQGGDAVLWEALRRAGADRLVAAFSDGLEQQLGQQFGGVGLSSGQWQRLALARVYLRAAPIWILDEPTSAIDAESEARIFEELASDRSERVTVVVSHRAYTLQSMDRIYVVDDGRIVESGTFPELVSAGGPFALLFQDQLTQR